MHLRSQRRTRGGIRQETRQRGACHLAGIKYLFGAGALSAGLRSGQARPAARGCPRQGCSGSGGACPALDPPISPLTMHPEARSSRMVRVGSMFSTSPCARGMHHLGDQRGEQGAQVARAHRLDQHPQSSSTVRKACYTSRVGSWNPQAPLRACQHDCAPADHPPRPTILPPPPPHPNQPHSTLQLPHTSTSTPSGFTSCTWSPVTNGRVMTCAGQQGQSRACRQVLSTRLHASHAMLFWVPVECMHPAHMLRCPCRPTC